MYVDHYSIQNTPGLLFVGFPSYPPIIGNVVSLDITHKPVLTKIKTQMMYHCIHRPIFIDSDSKNATKKR